MKNVSINFASIELNCSNRNSNKHGTGNKTHGQFQKQAKVVDVFFPFRLYLVIEAVCEKNFVFSFTHTLNLFHRLNIHFVAVFISANESARTEFSEIVALTIFPFVSLSCTNNIFSVQSVTHATLHRIFVQFATLTALS